MTRPQVRIEKIVEKSSQAPQSPKFSFIKIEMSYPDLTMDFWSFTRIA